VRPERPGTGRHFYNLRCGFVRKLQAEMANSGSPPEIEMQAGFLGLAPKTVLRQPTSAITGGIGLLDRAIRRDAFHRAAAIAIARAARQEAAEYAVFGVKKPAGVIAMASMFLR